MLLTYRYRNNKNDIKDLENENINNEYKNETKIDKTPLSNK